MPDNKTPMRERMLALDHAVRFNGQSQETLAQVLGVKTSDFDDAVNHHYRHLPQLSLPSHLAEIRAAIHPVSLPRVDTQAYLAEVEEFDGNTDQGDLDIDQALLAAPADPLVNEAMAWRRLREHDQREAARYFQNAIDSGGATQAEDYSVCADQQLRDNGDRPGAGGPGIEPAIQNLHEALKRDPSNPRIYQDLARAYLAKVSSTEAEANELSSGVGDDDAGLRIEYLRAMLLKRAGNPAAAREALMHVVVKSPSQEVRNAATEVLARDRMEADADSVAQLVNDGKFDVALAVIEAGRKEVNSQFGDANYTKMSRQVNDLKQVKALVDLYKAKDYDSFVPKAQAFVDSHPRNHNNEVLREDIADAKEQRGPEDIKPLPDGALTKDQ